MNTTTINATTSTERTVRVWDPLVRLFHWTVVAGVAANLWFTEEGKDNHQLVGYVVLGAVLVRLLWGFFGTRHARYRDFVPGPKRLFEYLGQALRRREPRYLGHNPAAVMMMAALIIALLCTGVSGWMMTLDAFWGEEWLEELHETFANAILALSAIHVAGAMYTGLHHRENLLLGMITGRKRAASGTDIDHATVADRGQPAPR